MKLKAIITWQLSLLNVIYISNGIIIFSEKFHRNIKSKYYVRPKSDAVCFAIHHFAGRVVYQADNFLEKNRNFLPPEVVQLMRQSQYDIIRFLFQCPITKTGNLFSALNGEVEARSLESPISSDIRVQCVFYLNILIMIYYDT